MFSRLFKSSSHHVCSNLDVYHVGINQYDGKIAAYNECQNKIIYFNVISFAKKQIDQYEEIFQQIQTKINHLCGQVGCVSLIYRIWDKNDEEMCKKIKLFSKKYGFFKIEIIKQYSPSLYYLHLIYSIKYKPQSGDVIWIFYYSSCEIWLKGNNNTHATLIKDLPLSRNFDFSTIKILMEIKNDSGIDKNPRLIFYTNVDYDPKIIYDVFPECQPIFCDNYSINITELTLVRARIMAGDTEVMDYDAKNDCNSCKIKNN